MMVWLASVHLPAQYLSHLQVSSEDPLYSTYAAPLERSSYKLDQGYQMLWNDPGRGIDFISSDGPNLGMAFGIGDQVRYTLQEMHAKPIVTATYSDMVRFHYRPFRELAVEVFFDVYSSSTALREYSIQNTGTETIQVTLMPFLYYPSIDVSGKRIIQEEDGTFSDRIRKKRDGWMEEHRIPVFEDIMMTHLISRKPDSIVTFPINTESSFGKSREWVNRFMEGIPKAMLGKGLRCVILYQTITLVPGQTAVVRAALHLEDIHDQKSSNRDILSIDLQSIEAANLKLYAKMPKLDFDTEDEALTYWSAFNLMRQCMMQPEGKCTYNYYVFSREPKWGWGYGGQVFHESLTMMAYALMDPMSAMNSQRVYMERQDPDGYINYRTGPYLDETIIHNGMKTSSAPWYNYQNLEIFTIIEDKQFLKEAYVSGKKFYGYYSASRDSNQNGLCSWGAHAELESVRDARVGVCDKVGRPGNFEGPDVNAMLVKEARSLSQMAAILGYATESKTFKEQADRRSALINRKMWDEKDGFYYNVNLAVRPISGQGLLQGCFLMKGILLINN